MGKYERNSMIQILKDKQSMYTINTSLHELPVVISLPHSGTYITSEMAENLMDDVIFPNTDWYLPKLYGFLKELGFTIIINNMNRHLIDVNRDINDKKGSSYKTNLIYTKTTQGALMYNHELPVQEIERRIADYYLPYHEAIRQALLEKQKYFKKVYLIDLHSFGLNYGADIILGNDNGRACTSKTTNFFKKMMKKQNFKVTENNPFAGGYITKYYGASVENCEAIQIELWYQTYIDKRSFGNEELPVINNELFGETSRRMENVFIELKKWLKDE